MRLPLPVVGLFRRIRSTAPELSPRMAVLVWILIVINVGLAVYGIVAWIATGHYPDALKDS